MNTHWQIRLFGGLSAQNFQEQPVTHFATHKTAALLAYLSFYRIQSAHPREILIELLWPDCEPAAGRNRLTTLLSFLRHLLEPPGTASGTVVQADRYGVRLNPEVVTTDVAAFERLIDDAANAPEAVCLPTLQEAAALYKQPLLAGFYDEWIGGEQVRLTVRYAEAQEEIACRLGESGALEAALDAIEKAIKADPYRESAYQLQMRLLAGLERVGTARQVYQDLERRLNEEMGVRPSPATRALAEQIRSDPHAVVRARPFVIATKAVASMPDTEQADRITTSPALDYRSVSLPFQLTRFFGREAEIDRLFQWLTQSDTRLITLTGAGGTGKTRLAIEAARKAAASFAGRVWFVDLASVTDPHLLPFALAHAMQLTATPRSDPLEQVVQALGAMPGLLVLDNFEHLLRANRTVSKNESPLAEAGTLMVRLLLERASGLKCLITSRQPLHVGGEQELPVPVLPVPDSEEAPEQLMTFVSVALYVDRAKAVRPDFALTHNNGAVVARLCKRLEGMPLAIEMAAAWAKTLPPAKILERLARRLDLLVSRRRDVPARQQSLRATIEWSYDLLPPPLQSFFLHLSVFRGGWTLEAAEEVCGLDALEDLAQLHERSLVVMEEHGGDARYGLLESLREFGLEKLVECGDLRAIQARHACYFVAMAESAESHLAGPEQVNWLCRLESEHANLRAAQTWFLEERNAELGLRMGNALCKFWETRGFLREGRAFLAKVLDLPEETVPTAAQARALNGAGALAYRQGDYGAAETLIKEATVIYRQAGDRNGEAQSLNNLGLAAQELGKIDEARLLHETSLSIEREMGNQAGVARSLNNLGNIAADQGDLTLAKTLYEEALERHREAGNRAQQSSTLNNLGTVVADQGNLAAAHGFFEEALTLNRELGDKWLIANSLNNLGIVAGTRGDLGLAETRYEEALALNRELGSRAGEARNLHNLGSIASQQGRFDAAHNLLEEGLAVQRELGDKHNIAQSLAALGMLALRMGDGVTARRYQEESLNLKCELGDKLGIARSMAYLAYVANTEGESERAVRLLAAHDTLRTAIHAPVTLRDDKDYNQAFASLRGALSDAAYKAAYAAGLSMTLEQATAYALRQTASDGEAFGSRLQMNVR